MFERCASLVQATTACKKLPFLQLQISHFHATRIRHFSASTSKISTSNNNYYEILGVTSEATPQEIKTAYYTLCKQFHPDITNEKDFDKAVVNFLVIGEAYECLSNKEARAEYDKRLGIFGPMGNADLGPRTRTQR
uniref:J domain-containing protein n=1 Tax=Romanomermis culicivorax TaxID=13658 RepID=A0A915J3B8_ROMCU